jgi:ABC-type polysaccharide/polyol phosphate transport system ATPase subunit
MEACALFQRVGKAFRLFGRLQFLVYAVNDVSLGIAKRQVIGLLEGNGAEKTTPTQMILGVTAPSSGPIDIDGEIAVCHQFDDHLTPELIALENLCFSEGFSDFQIRELYCDCFLYDQTHL